MFAVIKLFDVSHGCRAMRWSVCNAHASSGGRSLCIQISREWSYPWQSIDTTRKAVDCATTLPLIVFMYWNFAADFSSFIVEIVQKTTNLGIWSPFWGSWGRRRTLADGSLESPCRLVINRNWTSFSISYRWRTTRQSVSKLTAFWMGWVSLSQDFRGMGHPLGILFGFYKTRHILLSKGANCTVLRAVVLTQYRRMTDRQTDGQTELL